MAETSRRNHSSASPFEPIYGYSRAVRVGSRIDVAGCAPIEPDGTSTPGDAGVQAARCIAIIGEALESRGRAWQLEIKQLYHDREEVTGFCRFVPRSER